jgi:regulator of protease activity HflC (stomatin/prohibitin superfamily)
MIENIQNRELKIPNFKGPGALLPTLSALIVLVIFFLSFYVWFFCRIEPREGYIAVLIKKTGAPLPSKTIIATNKKTKGIQLEVLPEGRYFKNPYTYSWRIHRLIDIPAGQLGIKVRLYGDELPAGKIIASDNQKGIVPEVLRPGRYRINPYAYQVQLFNAIEIRPGHVGVVTKLDGTDVLYGEPENTNTFLVNENEKGVQEKVLDPGTYYLNPYIMSVTEVDVRSQRFHIANDEAIPFLSMDGFSIKVEGTIEWAIDSDKVAWVTHRIGDLDDIQKKIILPHVRGFMRIEGSKKPAVEYILGETRKEFQDNLFEHLKTECSKRGITIKSTLIRNIQPPDQISSITREREVAVQDRNKYELQIEEAKSRAELSKQEMLALQQNEKVAQETIKIKAVIEADQKKQVALTHVQKRLEVAKLHNEAAAFEVEAMMSKGAAESDVITAQNTADAEVLGKQATAFKGGRNMARYYYLRAIAPHIHSILGDQKGPLGAILNELNDTVQ